MNNGKRLASIRPRWDDRSWGPNTLLTLRTAAPPRSFTLALPPCILTHQCKSGSSSIGPSKRHCPDSYCRNGEHRKGAFDGRGTNRFFVLPHLASLCNSAIALVCSCLSLFLGSNGSQYFSRRGVPALLGISGSARYLHTSIIGELTRCQLV